MKHITATFLRGLVTLLPILLTVYILYWLAVTAESLLGKPLKALLPDWMYRPGLGLLIGVALVFAVGLVMELDMARRLWALLGRAVLRVPVVKTLYGAINDFAGIGLQGRATLPDESGMKTMTGGTVGKVWIEPIKTRR